MSGRGRNQSLPREWWAGSIEWSLSTFDTWHHALGTLKDACTLHLNSWRLSWPGTFLSSCNEAGMSSCHACHFIHSAFSMGEGSDGEVHGRWSPTPAPAGSISFSLRNSWVWGSRAGRHLRSFSLGLDQLDWLPGSLSSPRLAGGFFDTGIPLGTTFGWWVGEGYLLSQWEGLGDWAHLLAGSPWHDVTCGSHWWLPEHLWLLEHW